MEYKVFDSTQSHGREKSSKSSASMVRGTLVDKIVTTVLHDPVMSCKFTISPFPWRLPNEANPWLISRQELRANRV